MSLDTSSVGDFFKEVDEPVLRFWKKHKVFEKSVSSRPKEKSYVFYDGPPFVTGIPHFGHLFVGTLKDVIPRYQTMLGKRVERRWGWDCHGLPIEEKVERKLGTKNRRDIEEKIGLERFIKECKRYVNEISDQWAWYVDHIGRWVDLKNAYRTDTLEYMESVIWALKQMYEKGLLYFGKRISLYCPRCGTPVSRFETEMDNSYKNLEDPSVYVMFKLKGCAEDKTYLLVWTTTPWTLPANVAVAVNKDITYVTLESGSNYYILAKSRVKDVFKDKKYRIVEEYKGEKLLGLEYEPLFDYFVSQSHKNDFKVYHGDFVSADEGTGVVHMATAYGEDDFNMRDKYKLSLFEAIDEVGKFTSVVKDLEGVYFKEADPIIISKLKEKGLLFKEEKIVHSYPVCWRCQTPLMYKAQESWYIDLQKVKPKMLKLAEKIYWVPDHKKNEFRNVIESAPDWGISRTRFWATPLPFWECEKCDNMVVVGSIKEIEERSGKKVTDLHRPYIDEHVFTCEKCGGKMYRVQEVVDVWVESGSMPFAQFHYPFENEEKFKSNFPADYIVEYIAQVKAWFNVLHRVSTILFDEIAFKNVLAHGVILGSDGRKMSKSFGNYPDPKDTIKRYGADALRLYFLSYAFVEGGHAPFNEDLIFEQKKEVVVKLYNIYRYLASYVNKFGVEYEDDPTSDHVLDIWVKARVKEAIKEIRENLDKLRLPKASTALRSLINDVSVWYIKRSRDRITAGDKKALATLLWVLHRLVLLSAPFIPFITEHVYQKYKKLLPKDKQFLSVHLAYYPEVTPLTKIEKETLSTMQVVRKLASMGHTLRVLHKLPVRQPLREVVIAGVSLSDEYLELLASELNVKEIVVKRNKPKDLGKDYAVEEEKDLFLALKIKIDSLLLKERIVNEFVRRVQQLRKELGLSIGDKIKVTYYTTDSLIEDVLSSSQETIKERIEATEFNKALKKPTGKVLKTLVLPENKEVIVTIEKVA